METYNSEVAKKIYQEIQQTPEVDYPITADVVNGILQNFVYGHHIEYPDAQGETFHLQVSGDILKKESWSGREGIKRSVQNIINLPHNKASTNKKQLIAA